MGINDSRFVCSSQTWAQCPSDGLPEVAFVGRSNVGKSSLINMLTGSGALAKVSGTPGKTQLINHFLINNSWYLVDLPGYGYARTSKSTRAGFSKMIQNYVIRRETLYCLFLLLDCRHAPQKNDMDFLYWAGSNNVPLALIFTKSDKLSARALQENMTLYESHLKEMWEDLPPRFVTSSVNGYGREEIIEFIESFIF